MKAGSKQRPIAISQDANDLPVMTVLHLEDVLYPGTILLPGMKIWIAVLNTILLMGLFARLRFENFAMTLQKADDCKSEFQERNLAVLVVLAG